MLGLGKNGNNKWMAPIVPAYIATGPLATFIPLYIISIGGSILDVSYAITLASAITIPSVMLWGYVADRYNRRKALIVMSYLATTLLLASLFFINSPIGVIMLYAAMAFVTAATAAPISLLVIENGRRSRWAGNFALLQTLVNIGTSVGLAVSWLVAGVFNLKMLIIALTIPALASGIMATKMIKEPPIRMRVGLGSVSNGVFALIYNLVALPSFIIRIPSKKTLMSIRSTLNFRKIIGSQRRFVLIFYLISFIFFFATSAVNTEYPVALKLGGLTESAVFFIFLTSISVQGVVYYYYSRITKGLEKRMVSIVILIVRGIAYAFMGLAMLFVTGISFFASNLVIYVVGAGIAYGIYYPTSYSIFFDTLKRGSRGSTIGIYSAVIGCGTLLGALASGFLSVSYGFAAAFMTASALVFLCAYIFTKLPQR